MTERNWSEDAQVLADKFGVHLMGVRGYAESDADVQAMAMDAVPNYTPGTAITSPNDGYLIQFLNYIDPKTIDVLVAPNRAAEIFGEGKVGSWVDIFATFMMAEDVGQVASYGDFSRAGTSGTNLNYEQRQQFLVQAFMEVGDLETERAGAGRFDIVSRKRMALVRTLDKWQNRSYFFGVAGIKNYGVLNDPSLTAAYAPTTGAASGKITWEDKATNVEFGANEIYQDFVAAYARLQKNAMGLLDKDMDETTRIKWCVPPVSRAYLKAKNQFGLTVEGMIKEAFPNSTIETAPQFATAAGNILYAFVPEIEGTETVECAFSEKLRTHRLVFEDSSMRQKQTSGSWGAIVKEPFLIDQTLGI